MKRFRNSLDARGITMIEAMITIGIVGFVMAIIFSVSYWGVVAWQKQFARNKLLREAQQVMFILSAKLREAQASSITIDRFSAAEPDYSRISFTTIDTGPVRYQFYLRKPPGARRGQLIMNEPRISGGVTINTSTVLATDVHTLFFALPDASKTNLVIINLTLDRSVASGKSRAAREPRQTISVQSKEEVFVRNI